MAIGDDVFLEGFLHHKGTYWPREGVDGMGTPVYGAVQEIDCRWDHMQEEFVLPTAEVMVSNALIMVDRDMNVGDRIRLGALETVPNPNDAMDEFNTGTYEIKKWEKSSAPSDPDLWVRMATV